jgi:CheY-like chemotaxis protein
MKTTDEFRILVADDDLGVIASYRHVLEPLTRSAKEDLNPDLEQELFGVSPDSGPANMRPLIVDYTDSGTAALRHVRAALQGGKPYAVIFLDMRMPPGPDGLTTAKAIRHIDKRVHIVFVTGYSDHDLLEVSDQVRPPERLHYMSKPVAPAKLRVVASTLTTLWAAESEYRVLPAQGDAASHVGLDDSAKRAASHHSTSFRMVPARFKET